MDYPEFASDLAKTLHSTLFVDQVRHTRVRNSEMKALLREHIAENLVKASLRGCPAHHRG